MAARDGMTIYGNMNTVPMAARDGIIISDN
jgi:hypothetical protein